MSKMFNIRKLIIYRPYHTDFGWCIRERFASQLPWLHVSEPDEDYNNSLLNASLVIADQNQTTFLETFAANIPTLLFWNPHHWELRDSAQPYYDELKRTGILHDTPESAANKINEIYPNPVGWWAKPDIQEAKNSFCNKFAYVSDEWLQEWKTELAKSY